MNAIIRKKPGPPPRPTIEAILPGNATATEDYLCSIAISLKRIADVLSLQRLVEGAYGSQPLSEAGLSTASICEPPQTAHHPQTQPA